MGIAISSCVADAIRAQARMVAPAEACGLLFGEGDRVTDWQRADNVAEDPLRHFEIDPAVLFAAFRAERAGGRRLIGYWHSHPSGDASPSLTDAAMADPDGRLWLIVTSETMTAWRAVEGGARHGRFDPVEILE